MKKILVEAGHYYVSKGPTMWSQLGADIAKEMKGQIDLMLFIDDIHPIKNVSKYEIDLPIVSLDFNPDHTIYESEMFPLAEELLCFLSSLSKDKRAKKNNDGRYFISGFPITHSNGKPLCVLLDAALTVRKYNMGFINMKNVLPNFYEAEQRNLIRLLKKIMPLGVNCSSVFYDYTGKVTHVLDFTQEDISKSFV